MAIIPSVSPLSTTYILSPLEQGDFANAPNSVVPALLNKNALRIIIMMSGPATMLTTRCCRRYCQICWFLRECIFASPLLEYRQTLQTHCLHSNKSLWLRILAYPQHNHL